MNETMIYYIVGVIIGAIAGIIGSLLVHSILQMRNLHDR